MKQFFLSSLLLLAVGAASAQTAAPTDSIALTLSEMEIPNSPGFVLLDQAPTVIERPASTKAFALSVLNSFTNGNGLPKNYAVEFTPFWFFKHPHMTSYKYMGYNKAKDRQLVFKDLKKASISFAYVNTTNTQTNQQLNNFSLGVRTNILSVRSKKDIADFKAENTKVVGYLKSMDAQLTAAGITPALYVTDPTRYNQLMTAFLANREQDSTATSNDLKNILNRRPVFAIDAAGGYSEFFQSSYASGQFSRAGVWLTMNYSQLLNRKGDANNYISLYGIARYLSDGTQFGANGFAKRDFIDFGGKLELQFEKLAFGYEYIYRVDGQSDTFRSNGSIKYKISDKLYLTGAFGKNFGDTADLISLLGIKWGLTSGTEQAKVINE